MALKKICDRCGVELNKQTHFELIAERISSDGFESANYYYTFDLCANCMEQIKDLIEDNVKENYEALGR